MMQRTICQLDDDAIAALKVETRDPVTITGTSTTAATAERAYPEERTESIARIDNYLRDNAGVTLKEEVTIERPNPSRASQINMATKVEKQNELPDADWIRTTLDMLTLYRGDSMLLQKSYPVDRPSEFESWKVRVIDTEPEDVVYVDADTEIHFIRERSDREQQIEEILKTNLGFEQGD